MHAGIKVNLLSKRGCMWPPFHYWGHCVHWGVMVSSATVDDKTDMWTTFLSQPLGGLMIYHNQFEVFLPSA